MYILTHFQLTPLWSCDHLCQPVAAAGEWREYLTMFVKAWSDDVTIGSHGTANVGGPYLLQWMLAETGELDHITGTG